MTGIEGGYNDWDRRRGVFFVLWTGTCGYKMTVQRKLTAGGNGGGT